MKSPNKRSPPDCQTSDLPPYSSGRPTFYLPFQLSALKQLLAHASVRKYLGFPLQLAEKAPESGPAKQPSKRR